MTDLLAPETVLMQKDIEDYGNMVVDRLEDYCRKRGWLSECQTIKRTFTFSDRFSSSFGGIQIIGKHRWPFIRMAYAGLWDHEKSHKPGWVFQEYDHIRDDIEIGDCVVTDWKHAVRIDICHEVAHAVDFMNRPRVPRETKYYKYKNRKVEVGHGKRWQYLYRQLRNEFGNRNPFRFTPNTEDSTFYIKTYQNGEQYTYVYSGDRSFLGKIKKGRATRYGSIKVGGKRYKYFERLSDAKAYFAK